MNAGRPRRNKLQELVALAVAREEYTSLDENRGADINARVNKSKVWQTKKETGGVQRNEICEECNLKKCYNFRIIMKTVRQSLAKWYLEPTKTENILKTLVPSEAQRPRHNIGL